jgi:hypothetical protein
MESLLIHMDFYIDHNNTSQQQKNQHLIYSNTHERANTMRHNYTLRLNNLTTTYDLISTNQCANEKAKARDLAKAATPKSITMSIFTKTNIKLPS